MENCNYCRFNKENRFCGFWCMSLYAVADLKLCRGAVQWKQRNK